MSDPKLLDGAHLDFRREMTYGDYLSLDALLGAQRPRSDNHNELLFIIQHQTTELWMKQLLHELSAAKAHVSKDDLGSAFKMMARVSRIMHQLIQAWDVLSTLTPAEYVEFRPSLGQSSGFQSYQYRGIEFLLGNKNAAFLAPHAHRPEIHDWLKAILDAPSYYDEAIRLLSRRGFAIDPACLERDFTRPYVANTSVRSAFIEVYRDPTRHWDLYDLAEKFVDIEDLFRQWRFRHMTTVARVIGFKRGTGGTSGVGYLKAVMAVQLFPELWDLRTDL